MTHVTTLLIVLALTGSPAAEAVCGSWCESRPVMAGPMCHERIAHSMSIVISDGSGTCAALLAANPFLKEESRITFHAQKSVGIIHALVTPLTGGPRHAYDRTGCEAIDGRREPARVLRL